MIKKNFIYFVIFISFACFNNAYAYLDPGSGSIILQIIAAIGASLVFFYKTVKEFIRNFIDKTKKYLKKLKD